MTKTTTAWVACAASVSDRIIARKLEQQQKRIGEGRGGRGGEGGKLLSGEKPGPKIRLRTQATGVYDLKKLSGKSSWNGR